MDSQVRGVPSVSDGRTVTAHEECAVEQSNEVQIALGGCDHRLPGSVYTERAGELLYSQLPLHAARSMQVGTFSPPDEAAFLESARSVCDESQESARYHAHGSRP